MYLQFSKQIFSVNILNPEYVGGHCIAIDPWFIVHKSPDKAEIIKQEKCSRYPNIIR